MKKIFSLLACLMILGSCHKQEYYESNPNKPTNANPALLLTGICHSIFFNDPTGPAFAVRYLTYYERPTDTQNYGWATSSFNPYSDILLQVNDLEKLATAANEKHYLGLVKFFRAIVFSSLTETFGDIPYSQALKGEEGIDKPAYDSQESIYLGLLNELDQANDLLTGALSNFSGDIIFNGASAAWQKAVNAFQLRLLIHLSKKENNTSLNIKTRFANIVNNPSKYPLMSDIMDNAQLRFNKTATDNYYPLFNNLSVSSLVSLEKGLVALLKERNDTRLFQFGDPLVGKPANDFNSYAGVDAGLIISDQQNAAPNASKINKRYVSNEVNEPLILIGYPEQEFIIAEGMSRGWVAGNASARYINGIRASMRSFNIGSIAIEQYLGRPLVKFDNAKALEQIAIQKYLALFMQSGWESFFEQRRTGIPNFNVGPGTLNGGKVPKRWRYPQTEYDNNKVNVDAAVAKQFGGQDIVNQVMWLLQ